MFAFRPMMDIEHYDVNWVVALNMARLIWHNLVKVADNSTKICSLA